MKETSDNYEEFVEKTILEPISLDFFGLSFDSFGSPFVPLEYRPSCGAIKDALWDAFKAGRNYQFELKKS